MAEKKANFEENMTKLEEIAKDLENSDLSLDDSMKKFEEGMKIAKECKEMLDNAQKNITILTDDGAEKNFEAKQ